MTSSPIATQSRIPRSGERRAVARSTIRPLICFSHLRWNFVYQRPQHLMVRFAKDRPVIYFEEAKQGKPSAAPKLVTRKCAASGVLIATPELADPAAADAHTIVRSLLDTFCAERHIVRPVLWYYTPMMRAFSKHLTAAAVIYDCMDELANFRFAPAGLVDAEKELFQSADAVFTGGYSLYEAKQRSHSNVTPFPSSVDAAHFAQARRDVSEPLDQAQIPHPRFGFHGVIDERMDLELLAAMADARPDWQIVMIGPVVKVAPDDLPQRPNIHYLGGRTYDQLPAYLAGWDVAIMPFALNDATRYISPTKTPEYLAAGRPVVSTGIRDVRRHYEQLDGVRIADGVEDFVAACEDQLRLAREGNAWRKQSDALLARQSWDKTFAGMDTMVRAAVQSVRKPMTLRPVRRAPDKAFDDVIVGAGFAGSVLAERLAAGAGRRVLVIDRRPHVAGNAHDTLDAAGILVHQYGPHIFHTNSARILTYLSRFTEWRPYEHRVLAAIDTQLLPVPINRTTLNALYNLNLEDEAGAEAYLKSQAVAIDDIRTAEDMVLSTVGWDLYQRFFRGYTRKQWGCDPSALDRAVTARVPARFNTDDRYFTDKYQVMPAKGYTHMFENILDHPNITLDLGTDYADVRGKTGDARIIYSGCVDEYFDKCYGPLPYRSLRFQHVTLDQEQFQPVAVVNYPDEAVPHTRITEYKHLTGQSHAQTSISREFPSGEGDPYYPIPNAANQALYKRYEALAAAASNVVFVGRLGTYRYYNMDQVVGQALATYDQLEHARRAASEVPGHRDAVNERQLPSAQVHH